MVPAGDFRSLDVWQRSMDLAVGVYVLVATFPPSERFGTSDQMRRAAVSISSNIAEGSGRTATREYLHFISIAKGSLRELESLLELVARLGLCQPQPELLAKCVSIGQMLTRLRQALERKL